MKNFNWIIFIAILLIAGCKSTKPVVTTPGTPNPETPKTPSAPRPMGLVKPELSKPGYASMDDYIQKNVQYPEDAKKHNIGGTVMVSTTVDTLGVLSNVKAENDPGYRSEEH